MAMVFNATFNNISVISWRSFFLAEATGASGEKHPPTCRKFYHILYRVYLARARFQLTALGAKDTPCIGSNIFNYHTINTATAPS